MRIALDFDGTFTRDPELWNGFIAALKSRGHEVVCITERHPEDAVSGIDCPVHYTAGESKVRYSGQRDLRIDVWIDDRPHRLMLAD